MSKRYSPMSSAAILEASRFEQEARERARVVVVSDLPYDCHRRAMQRMNEDRANGRRLSAIDKEIVYGCICGRDGRVSTGADAFERGREERKKFLEFLKTTRDLRRQEREKIYGAGCA